MTPETHPCWRALRRPSLMARPLSLASLSFAAFSLAPRSLAALCALSLAALTGCGAKKDGAPSQTAAHVNKDEITIHQVNFALQQQRGLRPEDAAAASKLILERLIDQQLLLRKAHVLKLDRDPRVLQQIEAGKGDILARAVVEHLGAAAAKPSPGEIKQYFDARPALFSDRRVYNLQELNVEANPDQLPALREKLVAAKTITDFVEYLKAQNIRYAADQTARAAEQLPQDRLDAIYKMKDGQAIMNQGAKGVQVLVLASSRSQPVTEEQARPAIEQFLLNERKRQLVDGELKAMRTDATIAYEGTFAPAGAASIAKGVSLK